MSDRPVMAADVAAFVRRPDLYDVADVEFAADYIDSLRRACGWDGESDPPDFMVRGHDGALMRRCQTVDPMTGFHFSPSTDCADCTDGWVPVIEDGDTDE